MIEIIYQGEGDNQIQDSEFKLPKNVRQIGEILLDNKKIYVEDFVMTYVKHFNTRHLKYGVLLGNVKRNSGNTYLFITGAVCARPVLDNDIIFDEDVWTGIYEDIKTYFDDVEIVGWFLSMPGMLANDMAQIQKLHLDNFAGNDKVCFILDRVECEDSFYLYDDGGMRKCEGHYIYYEKNSDMQSYMMMNEDVSEIPSEYEQSKKRAINAKVHKILYKVDKEADNSATDKINGADKTGNVAGSSKYALTPYVDVSSGENQDNSSGNEEDVRVLRRRLPVFAYSASSFILIAILLGGVAVMHASGQLNDLKGAVTKMVSGNATDKDADGKNTSVDDNEGTPKIVDAAADITTTAEEKEETAKASEEETVPNEEKNSKEETETEEKSTSSDENNQNTENDDSSNDNETSDNEESSRELSSKAEASVQPQTDDAEPETAPVSAEPRYYTVQLGDSLYSISRKVYGDISMIDKIRSANGMSATDENIVEGQRLVLP